MPQVWFSVFTFFILGVVPASTKRNDKRTLIPVISRDLAAMDVVDSDDYPGGGGFLMPQMTAIPQNAKLPKPPGIFKRAMRSNATRWEKFKFICLSLGEGMGLRVQLVSTQPTDAPSYAEAVEAVQEIAFVCIAAAAYYSMLFLVALVAYRNSKAAESVKYYTNHHLENLYVETHEPDDFVDTFGSAPSMSVLTVVGTMDIDIGGYTRRRVAFNFALDVSTWIVCDSSELSADDEKTLAGFLDENGNALERLDVKKDIVWKDWEELATNIKVRIKQLGFPGKVTVERETQSVVSVYKNTQWGNFMRGYNLKSLVALSVFGSILYFPYMACRSVVSDIRLRFRVDVPIETFWDLIEQGLSERGFLGGHHAMLM
eukprot:TRINITY_DN26969_c0_g1_i1.p1 TRINITY_DN26969_c0_g1~~TRINITY_DN26969_c0_g1_i1.p1  ORF type:complete len:372 (-),score=34.88 TRINITY_DN26969_c0_g1_i1:97-1212(-)